VKRLFRKESTFPWKIIVGCLLLAVLWHLALLKRWHPKHPIPTTVHMPEETYMVMEPASAKPGWLPSWNDPTIFALPSDVGFSANVRHEIGLPKLLAESPLPPAVFEPFQRTEDAMFDGMQNLLASNENESEADSGAGSRGPSTAALQEGSVWRVTGTLGDRSPSTSSVLPVIISPEPLAPTVLRVGVNANGTADYILVRQSSGLEKADEAALRFARSVLFAPSSGENEKSIMWGEMKVIWRVEAPATHL